MELEPRPSVLDSTFEFDLISGQEKSGEQERLLNKEFALTAGSSFFDDFPVWREALNPHTFKIGVYHRKKLISTASIREAAFHLSSENTLSIGILGAVATDTKWRGCGAASQAVALALHWAKEKKIPLVVLWGSEHRLYQELGFELCGEQWRVPLELALSKQTPAADIKIKRGWHDSLFALLQQKESGLALSKNDLPWVSAHKNVDWWWTQSQEKKPICYAAIGRGIDLKEIIHEWGGEKTHLLTLLQEINKTRAAKEILGPRFLFDKYKLNINNTRPEYLCLAKALDPLQIFSAFHPAARPELPALGSRELIQALFGPEPVGGKWNQNLPLPLWFWGLDSA